MKRVLSDLVLPGLLIWPAASPASGPAPDTRHPQVRSYQLSRSCNYDRVAVGPDGNEVAIWQNDAQFILGIRRMLPPSAVVIGRMYGAPNSNQDKLFLYSGSALRLFPIRWSTSGDRLFIRVREPQERVVAIDPSGRQLEETSLSAQWKLTDINAITHGDVDVLRAPSMLAKVGTIDGKELIRGSATLGRTVELLGVRGRDLELVRFASGRVVDIGINSGHTRLLTAFPDERDFRAGISYLGAAGRSGGDADLSYQLPIVDLETGRVAGKFGPLQIQLKNPADLQGGIEQLNHSLNSGGGIILDASLSGRTLMALAVFYNGKRKLIRVDRQGSTEKLICKRPATAQFVHMSIFRIDRQGRETNRRGSPILVQYSAGGDGPRDAVLDFHGGPGGTLADDTYWSPPSLKLLRPDRDIIAIEYAGSLGGGVVLTRRLARHGMYALEQDIDAIAAWLSKRGYRRVYIFAGSFGSVPAMLALGRHRSLFAASFHTGPVLQVLDPRQWAERGGGLRPNNPDAQLAYELASYGGGRKRNRFAGDLTRVVAEARLGQTDHIYFGEFDDISKPEHLPSKAKAKITVIPSAGHAVLGADADVWRDIENGMK